MTPTKKQHGGARPGAGRKRDPTKERCKCQRMTLHRALQMRHACKSPPSTADGLPDAPAAPQGAGISLLDALEQAEKRRKQVVAKEVKTVPYEL